MNGYGGIPCVEYDGTNAEQILDALRIELGDAVVCLPDKPVLMKAAEMAKIERKKFERSWIGEGV